MAEENGKEVFEEFVIPYKEPVFTVSVVSRLLKIPVWVLKKFDREKVVCPKRSKGNTRLYSKEDVSKIQHFWKLMKKKNVKVSGIKVIKTIYEEYNIE